MQTKFIDRSTRCSHTFAYTAGYSNRPTHIYERLLGAVRIVPQSSVAQGQRKGAGTANAAAAATAIDHK